MSTRANIIIKDSHTELWFYRHSDGYPEGVMPTLKKFIDLIKKGTLRDDAMQSAGWLIIFGHNEYKVPDEPSVKNDWKVGAYEPTTGQHGDIEWLYTVDVEKMTIEKKRI